MDNKVGLPFIYVLICTLERVALPFYFRGCDNNMFRIKGDGLFVIGWTVYLVLNIIVMWLQVFWGGRFMLPKRMRGGSFDYYKDKEEILKMEVNVKEVECVICLQKVIGDEGNGSVDNSLISGGSEEVLDGVKCNKESEKGCNEESLRVFTNVSKDVELKVINGTGKGNDMEYGGKERGIKKKAFNVMRVIYIGKQLFGMCFMFYKVPKNKEKKPYMVTPCGHIFHTECLEGWFECKRECPNCRKEMTDY